jgi:hypothetical protein
MSIGFGLFLPIGVIIPSISPLRLKYGDLWFKIHKFCQITFLLLAWIGFIIMLITRGMMDGTLNGVLSTSINVHGPFGVALIVIISVQGLIGIFRPHLPKGNEKKSIFRVIFEYVHPFIGRSIIILGPVQCYLGFQLYKANWVPDSDTRNSIMTWALFQAIFFPIFVFLMVLFFKVRGISQTRAAAKNPVSHFDDSNSKGTDKDQSPSGSAVGADVDDGASKFPKADEAQIYEHTHHGSTKVALV